jgi:hypothetical protein
MDSYPVPSGHPQQTQREVHGSNETVFGLPQGPTPVSDGLEDEPGQVS